ELPRGLLVEAVPADWRARADRLGCAALHVEAAPLMADQVAAMRAAGYKVLVWTVNDTAEARRLSGWGVDAIITDVPRKIADALG
ncbi:MAG: glycerophosphoryl diester phosphodiesterase, partial [Caenispirillum bisanense]|nr:glycerophosphoryl diester phosphodiesterase [Caenispirillum bisanense]